MSTWLFPFSTYLTPLSKHPPSHTHTHTHSHTFLIIPKLAHCQHYWVKGGKTIWSPFVTPIQTVNLLNPFPCWHKLASFSVITQTESALFKKHCTEWIEFQNNVFPRFILMLKLSTDLLLLLIFSPLSFTLTNLKEWTVTQSDGRDAWATEARNVNKKC